MIDILQGVRLNEKIRRAVATTVGIDASFLTHIYASDSITIQFNNQFNDFRIFADKDEYLDYLIGMYEEGAMLGRILDNRRIESRALLSACKKEPYLRGKLEFTFDEMVAISEHYRTTWFSKDNMDRWGTSLICTLPYRMFITTDNGYDGRIVANLRIISKDGYIITLVNTIDDVDKAIEIAKAIELVMYCLGSKERAILSDLNMVWNTSVNKGYACALTFEDFNGNSFTIASDSFTYFTKLH